MFEYFAIAEHQTEVRQLVLLGVMCRNTLIAHIFGHSDDEDEDFLVRLLASFLTTGVGRVRRCMMQPGFCLECIKKHLSMLKFSAFGCDCKEAIFVACCFVFYSFVKEEIVLLKMAWGRNIEK